MKIIVVGASRGVGRSVVDQALARGHEVTAFARDPSSMDRFDDRLKGIAGDATDPEDVADAIPGHDAVFMTLGADNRRGATTLYSKAAENIVAAMSTAGVKRLIALSNFGVLGESSSHPLTALLAMAVRFITRDMLADHRLALSHFRQSSLDWTAVRPMALTDGPLQGAYRISLDALPSGGSRISRLDVADFMLKELDERRYVGQVPALAY
jgi:putative NADH-flavin reductase